MTGLGPFGARRLGVAQEGGKEVGIMIALRVGPGRAGQPRGLTELLHHGVERQLE